MAEYTELIKALRLCQFGECGCGKCYYKELKGDWCTEDNHPEFFDCDDKLKLDAAAAIEALQAEVERLNLEIDKRIATEIELSNQVDALQAEQKKTVTQIFGEEQQKWTEYCTALGNRIKELEQQMPKRGKWIRHPEVKNIYGGECIECPFCGEKYVVQYIADEKFCRNCGADMRKMEVQE